MSEDRTEARLREALQAVRAQSTSGPHVRPGPGPRSTEDLGDLHDLEQARAKPPVRSRWVLGAAAAVAVVVGLVALAGRVDERRTDVTVTRPGDPEAHAATVARVARACLDYQDARPPEPAPVEAPGELSAWLDRFDVALAEATASLDELSSGTDRDREVLAATEVTLGRQQVALAQARAAAEAGDLVEAVRLIDRARSYESIAAFELAQWGAVECDARGVTRPTR